jgi:sarcosine oxidase subunit beta
MSENERYDAIIVGAGVIGSAIAFELAKKGWRTLNVDKLPAAGYDQQFVRHRARPLLDI